eukprot:2987728-Prymnesium_polylepis.1
MYASAATWYPHAAVYEYTTRRRPTPQRGQRTPRAQTHPSHRPSAPSAPPTPRLARGGIGYVPGVVVVLHKL